MTVHTPLYAAEHALRHERQELISQYKKITGANLIVVIDSLTWSSPTFLADLLFDCDAKTDLHILLSSPGGDGEVALRMVRAMQQCCRELTVVVPDMAKSAATILCLGADHILMGPSGDLGPIDPQMIFPDDNGNVRAAASAKEIVAAVQEAEQRVTANPESYALFSALLSDVNMLMVEQARTALDRSETLMKEALGAADRGPEVVKKLSAALKTPLIDTPSSHSAVISVNQAREYGLPVVPADVNGEEWRLIWQLWNRYFDMGCWPNPQNLAIYEGARSSHSG